MSYGVTFCFKAKRFTQVFDTVNCVTFDTYLVAKRSTRKRSNPVLKNLTHFFYNTCFF